MSRQLDLTIDLYKENVVPIKLKQDDTTILNFTVTEYGEIKDLSGCNFELRLKKPDNTLVTQTDGINLSNGIVSIQLIEDCLRVAGESKAELRILKDNVVISTYVFTVIIGSSLANITPSNNVATLVNQLNEAISTGLVTKQQLDAWVGAHSDIVDLDNRVQQNTSQLADMTPYNVYRTPIFGTEYLSAYLKKVLALQSTIVEFSGDSTTAGDGTTEPYRINTIFANLCKNFDIPVTTYNHGHSGWSTPQWSNDGGLIDTESLPLNADLMVIRWGLNDARLDLNTTYFENALRYGLQKIRNARPLGSLSIILMSCNAVDCAQYPEKNPNWNKKINAIIRQYAKDFHCCFIDTFALWQDATNGSDWLDSYLVHPQNVANTWIASKIFETVFPTFYLKKYINNTNIINAPSTNQALNAVSTPSQYTAGITIYQTLAGTFPYDGNAITIRTNTDTTLQMLTDKNAGNVAFRVGYLGTDTWGAWIKLKSTITINALTLQNSWVNFGGNLETAGYYIDNQNIVHLQGMIKSGTKTQDTLLFTLPSGYIPSKEKYLPCVCATSTGTFVAGCLHILTTGDVKLYSGDNGWLSLDGITFKV